MKKSASSASKAETLIHGFTPYTPNQGEKYMNEAQRAHFRQILLAWRQELMEEADRTMHHLRTLLTDLQVAAARLHDDEGGFNTAELLGNAALAIVALVVIWGALQALGVDVVEWIRGQIIG